MVHRIVLLGLLLCLAPCPAFPGSYTEDFTTTVFRDSAGTTADWNTLDGELRLFPFSPAAVGSVDTPGNARALAVAGNHAYVTDASSGLQVIDITDLTAPVIAGNYGPTGNTQDVALSGDYAFLADGTPGLLVVDITDPTTPTLAGSYNPVTTPDKVVVAGDLAVIGVGLSGIEILDLTIPTSPTPLGSFNTAHIVADLFIEGDLVFVADFGSGLQIVDIGNPASPTLKGAYDTPGSALGVFVDGNRAYVADGGAGLQVIDVSDPANPSLLGAVDTPGSASKVVAAGNRVFVADDTAGLQVVDVSDPTAPVIVHTRDTPGTAAGIEVAGDHALVADSSAGLRIVRVAEPIDPFPVSQTATVARAWDVDVAGDLAFVADDGGGGVRVIDISDPSAPVLVGTYDTPGACRGITVLGRLALVADGSGLLILDVSDPSTPLPLGSHPTPGFARRVAVAGEHAFVADESGGGLRVIDISDPTNPVFAGACSTIAAHDVVLSGDHAYVADGSAGALHVVDISDPTDPVLAGTLPVAGSTQGLALSGDLVFLADGANVVSIDVSDATNPVAVDAITLGSFPFGPCEVVGDRLVTGGNLHVIDISDPTELGVVSTYDAGGTIWGLAVDGGDILAATDAAGLTVVRIFQDEVDPAGDSAGSLEIDGSDETIVRARVTPSQTDGVAWELTAGAGFQPFVPGTWTRFDSTGAALAWRSTLTYAGGNPIVTDATFDWLPESGGILSVSDVPEDQGGRVHLEFTRSGYDFADEGVSPVTGYNVYRKVDDAPLAAEGTTLLDGSESITTSDGREAFSPAGIRILDSGEETYVSASSGTFPPGTWALVGTAFATQSGSYLVEVATAGDSTTAGIDWSVYLVTTHTTTPSVWFAGAPDSGYSVDNIAPGVPSGFAAALGAGSVDLSWDPAPETDFQYFRVYRSPDPGFVPGPATLVHETAATSWQDSPADPGAVFYKLTALDHAGNESDPASSGSVTAVGDGGGPPARFVLRGAMPNPLRAGTRIAFDLPVDATVSLEVFDVTGRRVRSLAAGAVSAGRHEIAWDGMDDAGTPVAAGVYLYRLRAGIFDVTRSVVVIR